MSEATEKRGRQRLRPADPAVVEGLLQDLRGVVLNARDGVNATWRLNNLIHGIGITEAYIAQHRGRFIAKE